MELWLKGLIAAACVAIVVGVGYYITQDRQSRPSQAELMRQQNDDMERRIRAYREQNN